MNEDVEFGVTDFPMRLAVATALAFSAGVRCTENDSEYLDPFSRFDAILEWATCDGVEDLINLGTWPLR
jgi:hypothetical protein